MGRLEDFRARTRMRALSLSDGGSGGLFNGQAAGMKEDSEQELIAYLNPDGTEISQWWSMLVQSPYLHTNLSYANSLQRTKFFYDVDNNQINAFACCEDEQASGFRICFLGGLMRFSRLASLAAAADMCGRPGTAGRFAQSFDRYGGLSQNEALEEMENLGLASVYHLPGVKSKALAISSGMIISILAHEMGHICLGHVQGPTYYNSNHEISRNREREADSFASTITAASPFGEYMLVGILFWAYAMAQQEKGMTATTHPLSIERFNNFVRSNSSLASTFGLVEFND